jgi:hypothetical protein
MTKFFGKYRGKVENNVDPMFLGRLQVSVPAVLGEGTLSWAMPCVPFAGSGVGFFALPPKDANVWVEFERGDPDLPIWCGGFWGLGEVPATPAIAEMMVIKTKAGTITLNALPAIGGVTIETAAGAKINLSAMGTLEITNGTGMGSLKMQAKKVSINETGLQVLF